MLREAPSNTSDVSSLFPSGVSRIVSSRATFYIEMEKLIQNENWMRSDKDFIF